MIVVTGSGGFLGRAILEHLRSIGADVVGAGRPEVELPSTAFDRVLEHAKPAAIVHCAGPASVPASVERPLDDYSGSAGVVAGLLESVRRLAPAAKVVLISSAAVYGEPQRLPIPESSPLRPVSPYGFHRAICELLIREHVEIHGGLGSVLRVFSAYGEGLRRQLLWDVARQALSEGRVRLSGTGTETRDFVHATDVARAVEAAITRAPGAAEAFNVASGVQTTIAELADLLVHELDPQVPVEFDQSVRPGDPLHWEADISRLEALGYRPAVQLADGVRAYARWVRAGTGPLAA